MQQFCRGQGIVEVQKMMSLSLTLRSNLMMRVFLNFFCPPHLLSLYRSWSIGMVTFWSSSVYLKARSSRIITHRGTGVDNTFRVQVKFSKAITFFVCVCLFVFLSLLLVMFNLTLSGPQPSPIWRMYLSFNLLVLWISYFLYEIHIQWITYESHVFTY